MDELALSADAEAHRVRQRLFSTLTELENRRQRLLDVRSWPVRRAILLPLAASVLLLGLGVAVGAGVVRRKTAQTRLRRARADAWVRAMRHPERVASYADRPLRQTLLRKGVTIFATALLTKVAARAAKRVDSSLSERSA